MELNPMHRMMLRSNLSAAALVSALLVQAQGPAWTAKVEPPPASGLYTVLLDPVVVGHCAPGLPDLRLLGPDGREVPYRLVQDQGAPGTERIVAVTILRNEVLPKRTLIELEPPADLLLDRLHLWVRNAEADKKVRITGSDDGRQWFMLKDDHLAVRGARNDSATQVLLLSLPLNNRRYLRLELNDSLSAPVQVMRVGAARHAAGDEARLITIPHVQWAQRDSARMSLITVQADMPMVAHRILLHVADTLPFRRTVEVVAERTYALGRGRKRREWREEMVLLHTTLAPGNGSIISLDGFREQRFTIRIHNGDDRPLRISGVEVLQQQHSMLANLEQGSDLTLSFGDPDRRAPAYDASPFVQTGVEPRGTLRHEQPQPVPQKAEKKPLFDPATAWIWVLVGGLALVMGVAAVRMLRQPPVDGA
jgi:hypothetical protein